MHFLRLVGTFLDPTFLGLIIVFGILLSIIKLIDSKKKSNWGILLFLLFSLAFTYSRASYLALFGGFLVIASFKKFIGKALSLILVFGALMFLLPTSRNHSIELLRSISAIARIENYQTTIKIFTKSPIFGIGYDNICIAYQKFIGPGSFDSHACSGSDSSILFILATTGIAGIFVFIYFIRGVADSIVASRNKLLISATFTALFIHSIFSNSAFYPWILGWMMILLGITIKQNEI
jgi:O-antigen ligase